MADSEGMSKTPSIETVTNRLLAARQSANRAQVREGRAWYPAMSRFIWETAMECADESGDYTIERSLAVGVFCAYSQNATWKANVTMATNYLSGHGLRGLDSVCAEIERMEAGEDPALVLSHLKRPDFFRNLMGDESVVTCDRWHLRAALDMLAPEFKKAKIALTPALHEVVTEATRIVAKRYRETPAQCQAVIWCAVRGDGK